MTDNTPKNDIVFEDLFIPEPDGPRVEVHLPDGETTRHVGYAVLGDNDEVIALLPKDGDRTGDEFVELINRRGEMIIKTENYPDTIQGPEILFNNGEVLEEQ